jgi:hypothetical protein
MRISRCKALDLGRWTSTLHGRRFLTRFLFHFFQVLFNGFFIKLVGVSFNDLERAGWAFA